MASPLDPDCSLRSQSFTQEYFVKKHQNQIAQYALSRGPLSGAHAEFAAELQLAERNGRRDWCDTLCELHESGLADRAPMEMLWEFAACAPSEYLAGYCVGIMSVRESPSTFADASAEDLVGTAGTRGQAKMRGAALATAFMIAGRPAGYFALGGEGTPT